MENDFLSEEWIQSSHQLLDQINKWEDVKEKDRLEQVRFINFILSALQRSLSGWIQWVRDPDIMTLFSEGEMEEISRKISKFVRSFIEYDIEATKIGTEKEQQTIKKDKKKISKRNEKLYV